MIKVNLTWAPFLMLLWKEIRRFGKVAVQTILTPIVNSSLYLLIFGVSLGKNIQLQSGISYLAFIIPGLVMMGVLNNAFQNSSSSIVSGKFSGDLEDYKASPLSSYQIIWAIGFGGLFRGILVGLITFVVGQIFFIYSEGQVLGLAHPMVLIFFVLIGGLSFSLLGLAVAFWARTFDQMAAVGSFVLLPLIYLGGVFFSLENLHPLWQTISRFNPLLYLINGVRYGILGQSDVELLSAALISVMTLSVFFIVCLWSLRKGSFSRW